MSASRDAMGAVAMVANMLRRDNKPVRAEAASLLEATISALLEGPLPSDERELLATMSEWARQVAARADVPYGIRSAAAGLHDDCKRICAKTTGSTT